MLYISPPDYQDIPLELSELKCPNFIIVYRSENGVMGFGQDSDSLGILHSLFDFSIFWDVELRKWIELDLKKINEYRYYMRGLIFLFPVDPLILSIRTDVERYILQNVKYELLNKRGVIAYPPPIPDFLSILPSLDGSYNTSLLNSFTEKGQPIVIADRGCFTGYFLCVDNQKSLLKKRILTECRRLKIDILEVNSINQIPQY